MSRLLALLLLVAPGVASADDGPAAPHLDVQRFRQDPVGTGLPGMPGAELLERGGVHVVVGLSTASDLLEGPTESVGALVSRLTTLDVGLALGLGFADLFVTLPMHLDAVGGDPATPERPHQRGFGGLGDISIGGIVQLLDAEELTFGLAVRLEATLPTGDEDRALGRSGATFRPSLVTEFRAWRIRFTTETSVHLRPRADASGVVSHHALGLKMGLSITPSSPTELRALEVGVGLDMAPELPDAPGAEPGPERSPAEWRAFLIGRPTPCLAIQTGLGTGLGPGWGTPRVRAFVAADITVGELGGCGDRSAL